MIFTNPFAVVSGFPVMFFLSGFLERQQHQSLRAAILSAFQYQFAFVSLYDRAADFQPQSQIVAPGSVCRALSSQLI